MQSVHGGGARSVGDQTVAKVSLCRIDQTLKYQLFDSPRAVKVKYVANSVGKDASVRSCGGVWLWARPVTQLDEQMIKGEVADIYTRPGSCYAIPRLSSVLKS